MVVNEAGVTNGKQLKTHSEIVNLIAIDSSHLGSINVGLSLQTLITVLYICMAIIHCISYRKSKCQTHKVKFPHEVNYYLLEV